MAPSQKENVTNDNYSAEKLTELLEQSSHNLLVFGDTESRRHVRKVVNALGIDFETNGFTLKDNT